MPPEDLFALANSAAMAGWAVLVIGPRRFDWVNAVALWIIPSALSLGYALIVLTRFAGAGGGFDSLTSVAALLSNDWALLGAWVHFLAFDLFVGAIMAARMDRAGVGRVVQAPILLAIFLFGPFGFLVAGLTELGLRAAPLSRPVPIGGRHVPV